MIARRIDEALSEVYQGDPTDVQSALRVLVSASARTRRQLNSRLVHAPRIRPTDAEWSMGRELRARVLERLSDSPRVDMLEELPEAFDLVSSAVLLRGLRPKEV